MNFIDFFKKQYLNKINPKVVIKFRDGKDGFDNGLGDLFGVDLESDEYAGYIYYWDKGFLDYGLINLKNMNNIVPIELVRTNTFDEKIEMIEKIISHFNAR
jgi:hypothetical protein